MRLPNRLFVSFLLVIGFAVAVCSDSQTNAAGTSEKTPLPAKTSLDDYVNAPDDSYRWEVSKEEYAQATGVRTVLIDMVSQTWRTAEEVDRPEWQHWLTICIPDKIDSRIGGLMISGRANGKSPGSSDRIARIAQATNTVVAKLETVPNQPLIFHGDGQPRVEDEIVGYTWDQFLNTGDTTWPAFNPMVKSAVRAMDTVTAYMATEEGGKKQVDQFVVTGASKRGWTTWLTGAVDDRVVGIVPIVIDVLNTEASMRHHFETYGFWAPTVGDYVQNRIMERMDEPRLKELYTMIDPYQYRHRLKMPKLVLNASGDQFFVPDSSQFYWNDLQGDKYLRYVPNGDHSLRGTDAFDTVLAFHYLVSHGKPIPNISWEVEQDGTFIVSSEQQPLEVRLWQAHNPIARDFRLETLGPEFKSTQLKQRADGKYAGKVEKPESGWTAGFVEVTFDTGAPTPLVLSTNVQVLPDVKPFKGKDPSQPATLTVMCTAPSEDSAKSVTDQLKTMLTDKPLLAGRVDVEIRKTRCYINFEPKGNFRETLKLITTFLGTLGCRDFVYQIESGPGVTFPPQSAPE